MSRPFMTVISGLPMRAQLSPRDCGVQLPVTAPGAVLIPPVVTAVDVMHLFCSEPVNGFKVNESTISASYVA